MPAGRASVLGIEVVGDNAELLHGILRNDQADGVIENIDVLHAVQQKLRVRGPLSIDVVARAAIAGDVLTAPSAELRVVRAGAAVAAADVPRQRHEIIGIARQARQVLDLFRRDDLRDFLRLRIDFRRKGHSHDFYRRRYLGDRKRGVQGRVSSDGHRDLGLVIRESRLADRYIVRSRRQSGERIDSIASGLNRSLGAARRIPSYDHGVGNDRT